MSHFGPTGSHYLFLGVPRSALHSLALIPCEFIFLLLGDYGPALWGGEEEESLCSRAPSGYGSAQGSFRDFSESCSLSGIILISLFFSLLLSFLLSLSLGCRGKSVEAWAGEEPGVSGTQ